MFYLDLSKGLDSDLYFFETKIILDLSPNIFYISFIHLEVGCLKMT